ncbi:MAG: outer membrane lipoprotein carrier protein LolA [Bacteroidales bacterium]
MRVKTNFYVLTLLVMFSVLNSNLNAQNYVKLNNADAIACKNQIKKSAESVSTIQCNFVQEKEMSFLDSKLISKGKMYLKKDRKLLWQYTTPYEFSFVINENKIAMVNKDQKNSFDSNSNSFFKNLSSIVVGSFNGELLDNKKDFDITYFKNNNTYKVEIVPKNKVLGDMISKISLHFNSKDWSVDSILLHDKQGDVTNIDFSEKIFNKNIDNRVFDINK